MKKDQTKIVLLLVDDKPTNLLALQSLLEKKERSFLTAANGTEALKTAMNNDVDLIILDVQMPGMDGFEVAQILKSNKKTRDVPILFASAEKKEHTSMMKGFEEGGVDYLFKPLDPEITKAKVTVLLKIQSQKKELIAKNRSLEKSALLINNSADIIGIIDPATLKFEEVNKALTTLLEYPADEIRDMPISYFIHSNDMVHFQKMSKGAKENHSFETRVYRKSRTTLWLHWHVVVKDRRWFINARDVTDVKQVELIRNYIAAVVKQSSEAVYIHNHEGTIISWNRGAERMYGYSEQEALKMKVWNIIPEFLLSETEDAVYKIMAGEKIESQETKRISKHGKMMDVLFSASVLTDEGDQLKSIAITERDITEQKIADEKIKQLNKDLLNNVSQLETLNKELESFSYSVSHDLRAPLRAINGYANILKEDYESKLYDNGGRVINTILSNGNRMSQLIDDLLSFSKLGRKSLIKSSFDMDKLVKDVIDELLSGEQDNRIIDIDLGSLESTQADPSMIRQVWINLISNAIKYSRNKASTSIKIGSVGDPTTITYFVKDNGAGFDMNYYDKLFGVFQRLHSSEEFPGTGVGLALVKKIIERHNGKIWAESKPEEGAVFYFTLPK